MELRGLVNHSTHAACQSDQLRWAGAGLTTGAGRDGANPPSLLRTRATAGGYGDEEESQVGKKQPSKTNKAREFDCLCARVRRSCVGGGTSDVTALERGSSRALDDEKRPIRDAL
ncbi:hypothetical protein Y032_0404g851 [Ancylostoma ceylanicum]|uniref:Uncharacterized protein n=1 Tax=Ancylostoma ceylanicum TaxID=53326 RepID=A0A016X2T5_9BILA|nr:hypothetical protein Y032_0404g851 [Ancylostoma ceylanicum]